MTSTSQTTRPTPAGWPRVAPALYYDGAAEAIDWLCRAFGFAVRLRVDGPNGRIEHSELTFGEGVVMVVEAGRAERPEQRSPRQVGGANTQGLMLYVDDAEAHHRRAREAGAVIVAAPSVQDHGPEYWADRGYECVDPWGHHWWFSERLRTGGAG